MSTIPLSSFEVIDFHVHVYPKVPWPAPVEPLRQQLTRLVRPLSKFQQNAQTWLRWAPPRLRRLTDEIGISLTLPHLLIESDVFDLEREMLREGVTQAVIVPHPPMISNDFIFYESKRVSGLIPSVFIDPDTIKSVADLEIFYNSGIRLFKINPLQSGVPTQAPFYREFLSFLNKKKAVLLIHTGALSSQFFKLSNAGDISEYESWFNDFPEIRFVAAHMNFHKPEVAIQLAKKYQNLSLLTSWQPADTLNHAIQTVGVEKILFASDWPLVGENISVQKERLWSLYERGDLNEDDLTAIFSGNAKKLLEPLDPLKVAANNN